MTFAKQLRTGRKRLGITQAECAVLLSIPARTFWRWEHGGTVPAVAQEGALSRIKLQIAAHEPNRDAVS